MNPEDTRIPVQTSSTPANGHRPILGSDTDFHYTPKPTKTVIHLVGAYAQRPESEDGFRTFNRAYGYCMRLVQEGYAGSLEEADSSSLPKVITANEQVKRDLGTMLQQSSPNMVRILLARSCSSAYQRKQELEHQFPDMKFLTLSEEVPRNGTH